MTPGQWVGFVVFVALAVAAMFGAMYITLHSIN